MNPKTTADTARRVAYRRASPKLAVRINLRGRPNDIPHSPNCVNKLLLAGRADLGAEPADVGFDNFRLGVEVEFPDPLQQHGPRHHATCVAHEIFEQSELSRLKVDVRAITLYAMGHKIHLQVGNSQYGLDRRKWRPACQRIEPGQ